TSWHQRGCVNCHPHRALEERAGCGRGITQRVQVVRVRRRRSAVEAEAGLAGLLLEHEEPARIRAAAARLRRRQTEAKEDQAGSWVMSGPGAASPRVSQNCRKYVPRGSVG